MPKGVFFKSQLVNGRVKTQSQILWPSQYSLCFLVQLPSLKSENAWAAKETGLPVLSALCWDRVQWQPPTVQATAQAVWEG